MTVGAMEIGVRVCDGLMDLDGINKRENKRLEYPL